MSGRPVPPVTPPGPAPLLPDVGVVMLVPDRWSGQWQVRHQVASRLARYFHVVWVNPAHDWTQSLRPREPRSAPAPANLDIYTPERWLPRFYRPSGLRDWALRTRLHRARRRLTARGCRHVLLYVWRPRLGAALDLLPHDRSFYHIDDEYSFGTEAQPLDPVELRLIERVDQVFIHSPGLWERKGGLNPHTALVPNGVDYAAYATPAPMPADLAAIAAPRLGYTGWLKNQLDWPLLASLADRHPAWSFVFVGGVSPQPEMRTVVADLARRPNVHFLGEKTSDALTAYPQHFDVCLMPYARNAYTDCIYPLKLHEYLAGGRPVVGTPIRSLRGFGDTIALAEDEPAWSAAIAGALASAAAPAGAAAREARRAVARRHDWDGLVRRIAGTMAERLGHPGAGAIGAPEAPAPAPALAESP